MVLRRIVEDKRIELDTKYPNRSVPSLEFIKKSDRSFEDALRKNHTGYIFECKKASPSKGLIRSDFDPVAIAKAYAPFADAISVLTDEKYFQGKLSYLTAVRSAVSVPVLCKDFILEPFQIVEARKAGADAILLMMSVLNDDEYAACFTAAAALQIDALTEVRNEEELNRALRLGARIIGINNRNLDTLQVDLGATERLAHKVPKDKVVISESGIATHADILRLGSLVNGFLVGSSLMAKEDITMACGELVYGRTKVCGLTQREHAQFVKNAGMVYGGLIFAPSSKRVVTIDQARKIKQDVSLNWVGVFVDATIDDVVDIATDLQLSAVQLHGGEDGTYLVTLRKKLDPQIEIWKAVSVTTEIPSLAQYQNARILFDGKKGGSGESFDWSLLSSIDMKDNIVAGGIGADNAKDALALGAYALDINSKIETAPGQKDEQKLAAFLQVVRG